MKISELVNNKKETIQNLEKEKAKLEFYNSLLSSIKNCGGSDDWITPKTTLDEIADKLAINNIRFTYTGTLIRTVVTNEDTFHIRTDFNKFNNI